MKKRVRRFQGITALIFALFLPAGCATEGENAPLCPQAGILVDAGRIPVFSGGKPDGNIRVFGEITNFRGACRYKNNAEADFHLEIDFGVSKTSHAEDLKGLKLPYFIAVLGPDESILKKERFRAKIDFDNKESVLVSEEHDLLLNFSDAADARGYKIVFGFELTPDQLDYNRGKIR